MKIVRYPILFCLLTSTSAGLAQPRDSLAATPLGTADTIIVTGNEKTETYVILDEMTLKPGGVVTRPAMEFDKNRIYSLGLFNNVDIVYDSAGGTRMLFVDVHERWYLIPVPLFGFRYGDVRKIYFGGGVLHNNFNGRNQKLFGSIVFGYNPSLDLQFANPKFDKDLNLFFSCALSFSRIRNKSQLAAGEFEENHYDANGTVGKRFSLYETAGWTVGFQIVQVDDYQAGRTVSGSGKDGYPYGRLTYSYDSRDLREYPSMGMMVSLSVTHCGLGVTDISYLRYGADLRTYLGLPVDLTLATRVHGTLVSGGEVPVYNNVFFGYGERIRGYYRTVFEGENLTGASVELRYPLLKARTIYVPTLPLPREFTAWRFGISAALFGDTGVAWFRGEPVQFSSFASGYGGGIDLLLPYGAVVRLQYAFNDHARGQFILDIRSAI